MIPLTFYIAFFELITVPIVAFCIYKKQITKFNGDLVRKNGKKCLSPSTFLNISLVIMGIFIALIVYQINCELAPMV